jgi:hypothetical protein
MHARIRPTWAHSFSNQFLRAGLSEIAMTSISWLTRRASGRLIAAANGNGGRCDRYQDPLG